MVGGISSAESNAGGLVGAAAGWQITSRFGFEVDASWIDRAASEAGFAAGLHARWTLVSGSRAAPFLKTGGGLYHASFETGDDTVPAFYRDRLGDNDVGLSFTDPALIAGGGLDLLVSRRISLRPEANAMFVFDHGTSRVMPAFTLHLTFHFEEYPISPARK
jgi:hypothetical protein